jgi:hypothetical protein
MSGQDVNINNEQFIEFLRKILHGERENDKDH